MEADGLLGENGLEWVRKQDFWMLIGGHVTDSAVVEGVWGRAGGADEGSYMCVG